MAESFVDARHPDQYHREAGSVVPVTKQLECGRGESFGFVDDEQLNVAGHISHLSWGRFVGVDVLVGADADFDLPVVDVMHEVFGPTEDFGRVKDGSGSVREGVELCIVVPAGSPFGDVGLEGVPVCVAASGVGFPDARGAVANPDRLLLADSVGELGESPVFLGHDECLVHHSSSS